MPGVQTQEREEAQALNEQIDPKQMRITMNTTSVVKRIIFQESRIPRSKVVNTQNESLSWAVLAGT